MNYWPRWIASIRKKTATLSLAQMGAYDRLLDHYYAEEKPLPADLVECYRIAGAQSKSEREAVQAVLGRFFTLNADGYRQERADEELEIGLKKIATARENGKRGGRKPRKKPSGLPDGLPVGNPPGIPAGDPEETGRAAQDESSPISYQEPSVPNGTGAEAPPKTPKEVVWSEGVPLLTAAGMSEIAARDFLGGLCKNGRISIVADAVQDCARERPLGPKAWLTKTVNLRAAGGQRADFRGSTAYEGGL